jgi:histone deacetylase HOS3
MGTGTSPRAVTRAPSPPPPEVDWTVASHELSKLLIPVDRQTLSELSDFPIPRHGLAF